MSSTALGAPMGSALPTVLSAWLGDEVPPTAELAHEAFEAIARCADVLAVWRPQEAQWPTVRSIAREESEKLRALSGAHSSSLGPGHAHAMFGDFRNWPLYSSLVAGSTNRTDPTWSFVAALVAWPCLGVNVSGMHVEAISKSHRLALQTWLRESLRNSDSLAAMRRLLGDVPPTPRGLYLADKLPKDTEAKWWAALKAHAKAYCRSYPESLPIPAPAPKEDETVLLSTAIRTIIDHSVASIPENLGLAPQDAGAVRNVSQDEIDEDETTDPLARHHLRCLASAREFNHLPLHWRALNSGERNVLRAALETSLHAQATREGSVAIALCTLLALSPADVSALSIHASLDGAIAALTNASTTLAWVDGQLIALQCVPRPECAYRREHSLLWLPHRTYKALGIPKEICQAIVEAGGQVHGNLLCCFPALVVSARKLAADLRQATGARLHLGRIQRAIADCLIDLTHDEWIAEAILPGARVPIGAGSYYSAIQADRAFELHRQAASHVLPWSADDLPITLNEHFQGCHIGSELLIPMDALNLAVTTLHRRAKAASETGRRTIEVVANAFALQTMYIAAIGSLWLTHRPTHAPFPRPDDLQPSLQRALIVDKRAHARSTQRVVPMPAQLALQVEAYRKSVHAVARFLDEEFPELAGELRSTLEQDDTHFPSAAALSILVHADGAWKVRPLAPNDWKVLWPEWTWPLNGNRHVLMQWLQAQGVRRELLNYLFGHAEPGQALFGRDCAVTIDEFCSSIRPLLEKFGAVLDLPFLEPIRTYGRVRTQADPTYLPAPAFGDDARAPRLSALLLGTGLEMCRRILRDESVIEAETSEECTQLIAALVDREFPDDSRTRARAMTLLLRWKRMHPMAKSAKKGKRIPFAAESTPVTRNELADLVRGNHLQRALVQLLSDFLATPSVEKDTDLAYWWALLSLSATAFGGKHARDSRRLWLDAIPSGTFHLNGSLWIEWNQGNRLERWCADPITASLLGRFIGCGPTDAPRPTDKDVRVATGQILASLPPLQGIATTKRRLQAFESAMRALHRTSIPGPISAHMTGERRSAAVPRETLLRSTGVRLMPDPVLLDELAKHVGTRYSAPTADDDVMLADTSIDQLVAALGKAQGSSRRGGKATGKRGKRIKELKIAVKELEDSCKGQSPTFKIVCSRLRELANEGGRLKSILATSTIAAYMRPVIAFAKSDVGKQFLNADPLEIEVTYYKIVMKGCASKAGERLASLQDFHEHAVLHFGAVPVDWHEVAADLPHAAKHVNANLVYQHEVGVASALIAAMVDVPAHLVLMARATLYLMYDLGLRFGEVFRLRAKDVFGDNEYLIIRSTEHGEVKSHAGTRMVPLQWLLGTPGHEVLSSLLARSKVLSGDEDVTPLFCDPNDTRSLVLRADVVRIVAHALRVATGDLTIRPHHLRHSAVTNSYGLLVVDALDGEWENGESLRLELLSETCVTRRSTHAHSQLFGHGGPDTTALVYLHQQEFRAANWMAKLLPEMTSVEISGLTGWTDARVRKAWGAGKSAADILQMAVSRQFTDRRELDAWRNIEFTNAPLTMASSIQVSQPTIDLPGLREFLLHRIQTGLPAEALATLHCVPPSFAAALCRNVGKAVQDMAFALAFMSADEYSPWQGYAIRTTETRQVPPHFRTLPSIERMDALSHSRERCSLASTFVRTFDTDQNCWEVSSRPELDAFTTWLHSIGVQSKDVTFEIPCEETRVPDAMQELAGEFKDANFIRAEPRSNRMRGGERIRIRVRPDGYELAATTLTQATFLWVLRAMAHMDVRPNPQHP